MEIKGTLKQVCPVENITGKSGNTFQKRVIVVDCSSVDEVTGEIRENILAFETGGRFVNDYDRYVGMEGKPVAVRFGISGRSYESNGVTKYMTTLRLIGLVVPDAVPAVPNPQPAPQPAPAPKTDFNQKQNGDGLPF